MICEHCEAITKLEDEARRHDDTIDELIAKIELMERRYKRKWLQSIKFIFRLSRRFHELREQLGLDKVDLLTEKEEQNEIEEQAQEEVQTELD